MSLPPGTKLGTFEISGLLGKGGMGEVYRARDTGLNRSVAIKVLPESFAANPERVARFEREARLLATLSHQNIAGIHGLEEQDSLRYLVLELVEGETLKAHLEEGATPVEETLRICCQIADAVAAAHEKGVVHRDLKPSTSSSWTARGHTGRTDPGRRSPANPRSSILESLAPLISISRRQHCTRTQANSSGQCRT